MKFFKKKSSRLFLPCCQLAKKEAVFLFLGHITDNYIVLFFAIKCDIPWKRKRELIIFSLLLDESQTSTMKPLIFFALFVVLPSMVQCRSGSFKPIVGLMDSLDQVSFYRMVTERECVSVCLEYTSPSCYAISYENFRQECRLITESVPSSYVPNQSYLNWRSYIRSIDV